MHEKRFQGDINRLRSPERIQRLEVERVVDLCLENADMTNVLEVGVGTGLFAEVFARRGLQVVGVDANPEMIAVVGNYVPQGEFRLGTAEALPYPPAAFDLLFYGLVLHESDEPLKVLKEARRVTRQRVCMLEWPYREQEFGAPLSQCLNPNDLIGLVAQAGFSQMETISLQNLVLYRLSL